MRRLLIVPVLALALLTLMTAGVGAAPVPGDNHPAFPQYCVGAMFGEGQLGVVVVANTEPFMSGRNLATAFFYPATIVDGQVVPDFEAKPLVGNADYKRFVQDGEVIAESARGGSPRTFDEVFAHVDPEEIVTCSVEIDGILHINYFKVPYFKA